MSATLDYYKEKMPTIFSVIPTLTKKQVEDNFKKVPAVVKDEVPVEVTQQKIVDLFDEVVKHGTIEAAITANGGLMSLAGKLKLTREQCRTLLEELRAGYSVYKTPEVEDVTTIEE